MNVLVVGNVIKDVYLNLDDRTENFETDKDGIRWLDLSFDASEHHFFHRFSSLGGAAVSLEVLKKMELDATISDQPLTFSEESYEPKNYIETYRYILISDEDVSYLAPSNFKKTVFTPPTAAVDYLFLDRSAELDLDTTKKIKAYLDVSPQTKLVIYLRNTNNQFLNGLLERADLIFSENHNDSAEKTYAPELEKIDSQKIITISDNQISYLNLTEKLFVERIDILTHLSAYSIISATILGGFMLGYSVEDSLKMARANVENSKLDSVLSIAELQTISQNLNEYNPLELIATNLVLPKKGILAADESGGSIQKKFAQLNIPDTYENRRDYRNIFLSTPNLEKYVNGVILFDETARQQADDGQNFVDYLTSRRIIPGIKVDQGLEKFENSEETYTKGLEHLADRLEEYYNMGLRFAKWRAAFEIRLDETGKILTPTDRAIDENCRILTEYALACQSAGLVPIVEPEVVYDGNYSLEQNATITAHILNTLFEKLTATKVNLHACILKTNMVIAGKQFETPSTPEEVSQKTAEILKTHVPHDLAGVVFLSGGQTVEQATENLAAIEKNGPFPWPVTFSFARALQDPALYAWKGDNANADAARQAFLARLIANTEVL